MEGHKMKTLKGVFAVLVSLLLLLFIVGIKLLTLFWGDASAPEIEISEVE